MKKQKIGITFLITKSEADDASRDEMLVNGFLDFFSLDAEAAQTKKHKVELFRIDTLRSNNGASVSNTRNPFF